jgi:hypothetical protein
MKCRKARRLIPSYRELVSGQKNRLDEHLSSCPGCSLEFSSYLKSIDLCREAVSFHEPKDLWGDFWVNLNARIDPSPLWSRLWAKAEAAAGLFQTPVLGPVPAYMCSAFLILLLGLGLYGGVIATGHMVAFRNDIVTHELEVRGTFDDGQYSHYIVAVAEQRR